MLATQPVRAQHISRLTGLHFDSTRGDMFNTWRGRSQSGPFFAMGDAGLNMPGDWLRIDKYAIDIRTNGIEWNKVKGNGNSENQVIWSGYVGPGDFRKVVQPNKRPVWHGVKLAAAGYWSLVNRTQEPDEAEALAFIVKDGLLYQAKQTNTTAAAWSTWPVNKDADGYFEAAWLTRLLFAYDYTKHTFTTTERDTMQAWFSAWADTLAKPIDKYLKDTYFPNRDSESYAVSNSFASPTYPAPYMGKRDAYHTPDPTDTSKKYYYNDWSDSDYAVLYELQNGQDMDSVTKLSVSYNNRYADRFNFVGLYGVLFQDNAKKTTAVRYAREWMRFAVWPDGAISEFQRNGDRRMSPQGFWYGHLNIQQYVMLAYALVMLENDSSLFRFHTDEGRHGTQCTGSEPDKTILTVLKRYAHILSDDDADAWYMRDTSGNQYRIDPKDFIRTRGSESVFDQILALGNMYYKDTVLLRPAYMRTLGETRPYPGGNINPAHSIMPYGGPSGILPGTLFMFGMMEDSTIIDPDPACGAPLQMVVINSSDVLGQVHMDWKRTTGGGQFKIRDDEDKRTNDAYPPQLFDIGLPVIVQYRLVGSLDPWKIDTTSSQFDVIPDSIGLDYEANVRRYIPGASCPWSKPAIFSTCNYVHPKGNNANDPFFVSNILAGSFNVKWHREPIAWLEGAGMYGYEMRWKRLANGALPASPDSNWISPHDSDHLVPDDTLLRDTSYTIQWLLARQQYEVSIHKLCRKGKHGPFRSYKVWTDSCARPGASLQVQGITSTSFRVTRPAASISGTRLVVRDSITGDSVTSATIPGSGGMVQFSTPTLTAGRTYRLTYWTQCDPLNRSAAESVFVPLQDPGNTLELISILSPGDFACFGSSYRVKVQATNTGFLTLPIGTTFEAYLVSLGSLTTTNDTMLLSLSGPLAPGDTAEYVLVGDTVNDSPYLPVNDEGENVIFVTLDNSSSTNKTVWGFTSVPADTISFEPQEQENDFGFRPESNEVWSGYGLTGVPPLHAYHPADPEDGSVALFAPKGKWVTSYYQSPCLTVPDTNDLVSFQHSDMIPTDTLTGGTQLQVSFDQGVTFTAVPLYDAETWERVPFAPSFSGSSPMANGRWHKYIGRLDSLYAIYPAAGGSRTLQFRLVGSGALDAFGVDYMTFSSKRAYDVAAIGWVSPLQATMCARDTVPVKIALYNAGRNTIGKFTVRLTVVYGSDTSFVDTQVENLAVDERREVFLSYVNIAPEGYTTLSVSYLDLAFDGDTTNNRFLPFTVTSNEFNREEEWHLNVTPGGYLSPTTPVSVRPSNTLPTVIGLRKTEPETILNGQDNFTSTFTVTNLNLGELKSVQLSLYYPGIEFLDIYLKGPTGDSIQLTRTGYAQHGNEITYAIFDDELGHHPLHDFDPPYMSRYSPFDGHVADVSHANNGGTWTLRIVIDGGSGTPGGILKSWGLAFDRDKERDTLTWTSSTPSLWSPSGARHDTAIYNVTPPQGGEYAITGRRILRNGCISQRTTFVSFYDAVWNGTQQLGSSGYGHWNNPANWTPAGIPGFMASVRIPSSATYPPLIDSAIFVNTMMLDKNLKLDSADGELEIQGNLRRANPASTAVTITNYSSTNFRFKNNGTQFISGKFISRKGLYAAAKMLTLVAGSELTLNPGAVLAFHNHADKSMTVEAGATLRLTSSQAATASLGPIHDGSNFIGKLTLERWVKPTDTLALAGNNSGRVDYHQVSLPFQDANLFAFGPYDRFRVNPKNNCNFFGYTENDTTVWVDDDGRWIEHDGWKAAGIHGSQPANPGGVPRGLRLGMGKPLFNAGSAPRTLEPKGTPFTHEQAQRITFTPGMWEGGGYNLIANPYPSDIDWEEILPDNDTSRLTSSIFIWNPNNLAYGEYNASTNVSLNGTTNKIASTQSFFIHAKQHAGTLDSVPSYLTILESHKLSPDLAGQTASFLRSAEPESPDQVQAALNTMRIRISSSPNQGSNESVLRFVTGGHIYFDDTEDSEGLDGNVNFSTMSSDGIKTSINTYPIFNRRYEVFCRFKAPTNTTYTVRFDSLESFTAGSRFFLKDNGVLTGRDSIQDLHVNTTYSFLYTGTSNANITNRFTIICYAPTVAVKDELPSSGGSVVPLEALLFPNPAKESLTVRLMNGRGKSAYRVVSVTGQVVMTGKAAANQFSLNIRNLPKGMYLVQVSDENRNVTRRFIKE